MDMTSQELQETAATPPSPQDFDPQSEGPGAPAPASAKFDTIRFAITTLCVGLLCLGVIWRFVDLDYPRTFSFDEHHFVSNARNYIAHRADWNDHPPLGKLVLYQACCSLATAASG